jgi:hypothetical protein
MAAVAALLLGGCSLGGDDSDPPPPRPPETTDKPAKLPPGWGTYRNRLAGFTIGIPPLWSVEPSGASSVLTSPDKQVAISVSADRTDEALGVPLERFAAGTAQSLSGFKDLKARPPKPYRAHYPAEAVRATGVLEKNGVHQRLALVILRRENIAAYPVLAAANTGRRTPFARQIDPIIRSLRGRPVEAAGG